MLEHNITIAWRNIRKYLSQNIISVVGLSASLVCFSICMHINRFYLEQYDSLEKRDQIVDISFQESEGGYGWMRSQDGQRLKTLQMQTLSHINLIITPSMDTYINDADGKRLPYQLRGVETDTAFAALFTPTIVAGSWELVARNPNSLVLTASAARRIFGTEADAIGKVLNRAEHVYRNETYTVRAVMEDLPKNKCAAICGEELGIDLLRVNELAGLLASEKPHHYYTYTRGLLAEGCSVEDVTRELKTVMTHFPLIQGREREENELFVAHRIGNIDEEEYTIPSLIVTGIAVLLLSVGLLNFLHFLTGTLLNRTREYSMR
ncbi:MAG: ABC transporter permease, partial [Bacteroidaceae bacterium]|nr:ABC transporter permease [Bacteroidaceae bacterium]